MTVDNLDIQISTSLKKSDKQLDNLIKKLNTVSSSLSKVGTSSSKVSSGGSAIAASTQKSTKSFKGLASAIGKFYAGYAWVIRGIKGLNKSIQSTADYLEAFNYFEVSFNKIAREWEQDYSKFGYESAEAYAKSFSKRAKESLSKLSGVQVAVGADGKGLLTETGMKNLGLNIQEITQYASQLASVTNSIGQTGEVSLRTSNAFTKLAGDISSLFNQDYSAVAKNLQSGLIGQSRALYKYGIDITNATLQTYAYNLGIEKNVSEMTQAEKMQLRMIAILEQSKVSWGDLANTINSPSNMLRQFKNNLKEVGMMLGQLFIPLLQRVLPVINGATIAIKNLLGNIAGFLGIKLDLDAFGQSGSDAFDDMSESMEDVAESANKAKKSLRGFDELKTINIGSDNKGLEDQLDLTNKITAATQEYENVWNEAYLQMQNRSQEFAEKITEFFQESGIAPIFEALYNVAEALTPILKNLWDVFFEPLLNFTGDVAVFALNSLATALTAVSDWMTKNEELIVIITEYAASFLGVWAGYTILTKAKDAMETLYINMLYFKDGVKGLVNPTNLLIGSFALLAVGIIEVAKHWDEMSSLKKVVTILSSVAAAAAAAAVAIGIFHASWSVGVAAAAIASGIALIAATQITIKDATDSNNYKSIPQYEVGGFPQSASLFWANENGVPELVGTMGGKTAVASGMEITGIKDEIRASANEEIALLRQQNALLQGILEKEYGITDSDIGKSAQRYAKDYFNRTGEDAYSF